MTASANRQVFVATKNLVVSNNKSTQGAQGRLVNNNAGIGRVNRRENEQRRRRRRRDQPAYILHISREAKEAAKLSEAVMNADQSSENVVGLRPLKVRPRHTDSTQQRQLSGNTEQEPKSYPPELRASMETESKNEVEPEVIRPDFDEPAGTNGSVEKTKEPQSRNKFVKEHFEKISEKTSERGSNGSDKEQIIDALNKIVDTL
jgi:hypothetical protein